MHTDRVETLRQFIPCDIVSLALQATGGGMAAAAYGKGNSTKLGNNISKENQTSDLPIKEQN